MKGIVIITCLLLAGIQSFAGDDLKSKKQSHSVRVISRRMDTFFFKACKNMIGAEIEVYSEIGEKVKTGIITKKHALIDFYFEDAGVYRIVFRKGDQVEIFEYVKTTAAPEHSDEVVHFNIA